MGGSCIYTLPSSLMITCFDPFAGRICVYYHDGRPFQNIHSCRINVHECAAVYVITHEVQVHENLDSECGTACAPQGLCMYTGGTLSYSNHEKKCVPCLYIVRCVYTFLYFHAFPVSKYY